MVDFDGLADGFGETEGTETGGFGGCRLEAARRWHQDCSFCTGFFFLARDLTSDGVRCLASWI
jgi:hypothetical protein